MTTHNIYLAQPNYLYGDAAHLPYAAACLAANAFSDQRISSSYHLKRLIYRREPVDALVASLEAPSVFGFSSYVWNHEYNKTVARALKKRFPECRVIFGGHHVPKYDTELLRSNPWIDILVFGAGEVAFKKLLLAFTSGDSLDGIENIAFRNREGSITVTEKSVSEYSYISPYSAGMFDTIVNDPYGFAALLETNRGCPFGCAYCDWGAEEKRLRKFPMEQIKEDIHWIASHKIAYVVSADSNFGILKRDMEIIDELIRAKSIYGYPQSFRASYTKNSSLFIYQINEKLHKEGMSKGATLSFQSFNQETLNNVGRKNIPTSQFSELFKLYTQSEIPTYSELILGLPGETLSSFQKGVSQLLASGQHSSINIYNCEILPNSSLAQEEYIKKFAIKEAVTPLYQYHSETADDGIPEFSRIIVATESLSESDWIEANIYGWAIQTFHCLGLLQKFAVYAFYAENLPYDRFYTSLLDFIKNNKQSLLSSVYSKVSNIIKSIPRGESPVYITDSAPEISFPLEEGAFIDFVDDIDEFYLALTPFLHEVVRNKELYDTLLAYQKNIISVPRKENFSFSLDYDLFSFFEKAYLNENTPIKKIKNTISVDTGTPCADIQEYAVKVVWYGRKGGKTTYFFENAENKENIVSYR